MKKYPADIMVDEFIIPVMESKVKEALLALGYEPSKENVHMVLEADLLTSVCQSISKTLPDIIEMGIREYTILGMKNLDSLTKRNKN